MNATPSLSTYPDEFAISSVLERIGKAFKIEALISSDIGLEACKYHFAVPGKCMRARLCLHAGAALQIQTESAEWLAATVESLHNASLVLDDMQDGALTRRGQPSVCASYGSNVALAVTLRLTTASFHCLSQSESSRLAQLSSQTHHVISETAIGQTRDLDENQNSAISDLHTIASLKSGPLFGLALSLPLIFAGYDAYVQQARRVASLFGLGYQMLDDIKDRSADRLREGDANIVNALEDKHGAERALCIAREEGRKLLAEAEHLAAALPRGSGAAVVELIRSLEKDGR